jgi:hypothetical protein
MRKGVSEMRKGVRMKVQKMKNEKSSQHAKRKWVRELRKWVSTK